MFVVDQRLGLKRRKKTTRFMKINSKRTISVAWLICSSSSSFKLTLKEEKCFIDYEQSIEPCTNPWVVDADTLTIMIVAAGRKLVRNSLFFACSTLFDSSWTKNSSMRICRTQSSRTANFDCLQIVDWRLNKLLQLGKTFSIDWTNKMMNHIDFIVDFHQQIVGVDD